MRRRRKAKYTWLPVFGTEYLAPGDENADNSGVDFILGAGPSNGLIFPLTSDLPVGDQDTQSSQSRLSDAIGQEWFLRRIVGKCFVAASGTEGAGAANAFKITAGFLVARAGSVNGDIPIGASATWNAGVDGIVHNAYGPQASQTQREPWIWRRTWILGNPSISSPFPPSNTEYGSVMDGAHIDAKTLRRISNDDRLWFAIECSSWPYGDIPGHGEGQVAGHLDVRLLGNLRRAHNRGVF